MVRFTEKLGLYKWDKADEMETSIIESANNADRLETKLVEHDNKFDTVTKTVKNVKEELPAVIQGDFAFATDTDEVFIGGQSGNIQLAKQNAVDTLNEQLADTNKKTDGIVNVKSYGAVGDGITNDTTAIQNALNTGQHVLIPYGTFLLTGEVVTFVDGQKVFGVGTIKCGSSTAQITLNHKKCKVTGITFDGGNDTVNGTYCIRMNGTGGKVSDCYFEGKIGHYVLVANTSDISVTDNTFKGTGFTQTIPVVFSGVTNFIAEGNHFIDVYGFNLQTRWSFDGTIANNKFNNPTLKDTKTADGVATSYSFTLSQKAHTNGASTRVGLKRNGVPLATTDATYPHTIDVTNAPTYVVTFTGTLPVNGDVLDLVGWRSLENININSESADITVIGNTLNGSGDSGVVLCADYVNRVLGTPTVADYPKRVSISANVIKNIAYAGIAETHSIEGVSIQGNTIVDCGHKTDGIYSTGIYVTEGDTTIVGNSMLCTSNGYMKYGIHVNQSPDNTSGALETSVKIGLNKYKGLKTQNIYLAASSSYTLRKRSIMIVDGMEFNYGKVDLDSAWTNNPVSNDYFTYGKSGGTGWNRDIVNKVGGAASLATVAGEYVSIVPTGKELFDYTIVRASFIAKAQSGGSAYARLSYQFTGDTDDEPAYQITLDDTTKFKRYYLLMAVGKGTDISAVRLRIGGTVGVVNVQHITFDYIPYN